MDKLSIPKDKELERAFLYGFLDGTPSPSLPPEAVLDYHESEDLGIKAAFESGRKLAERHSAWWSDCIHSYYQEPLKEIAERLLKISEGEGR